MYPDDRLVNSAIELTPTTNLSADRQDSVSSREENIRRKGSRQARGHLVCWHVPKNVRFATKWVVMSS